MDDKNRVILSTTYLVIRRRLLPVTSLGNYGLEN